MNSSESYINLFLMNKLYSCFSRSTTYEQVHFISMNGCPHLLGVLPNLYARLRDYGVKIKSSFALLNMKGSNLPRHIQKFKEEMRSLCD